MPALLRRLATALNAAENFGDPLQIAASRLFRKPCDGIRVTDRASGVSCICRLTHVQRGLVHARLRCEWRFDLPRLTWFWTSLQTRNSLAAMRLTDFP